MVRRQSAPDRLASSHRTRSLEGETEMHARAGLDAGVSPRRNQLFLSLRLAASDAPRARTRGDVSAPSTAQSRTTSASDQEAVRPEVDQPDWLDTTASHLKEELGQKRVHIRL